MIKNQRVQKLFSKSAKAESQLQYNWEEWERTLKRKEARLQEVNNTIQVVLQQKEEVRRKKEAVI